MVGVNSLNLSLSKIVFLCHFEEVSIFLNLHSIEDHSVCLMKSPPRISSVNQLGNRGYVDNRFRVKNTFLVFVGRSPSVKRSNNS